MIYFLDSDYDSLAWLGMDASSMEKVYNFLTDSDYRIRTIATQIVHVKYGTKRSFKIAKKMTKSKKWEYREIGAYILGQLGTPKTPFIKKSLPILIKLIDDKNEDVISTSISSIWHLLGHSNLPYNKKLVKKIIKFTKHKSSDIRISSVLALSALGNTKKIKKCVKKILKKDKNKEVREWAELALEILEDR